MAQSVSDVALGVLYKPMGIKRYREGNTLIYQVRESSLPLGTTVIETENCIETQYTNPYGELIRDEFVER